MDELKRWYLGTLEEQARVLRGAGTALEEGDEEAVQAVRRIAHGLRGSGGTYGFPDISSTAGMVEEAATADLSERLTALLASLSDAIDSYQVPSTGEPGVILLVEDDEATSRLLETMLVAAGHDVQAVATGAEAEQALASGGVAVVVLDLVLPDRDGRDLLSTIRSQPATASIPVVALTVVGGATSRAECLDLGADSLFEKPFHAPDVTQAISALHEAAVGGAADQRDRTTGVLHRAAFLWASRKVIDDVSRSDKPVCLGLLDLDRFRTVNDSCGEDVGDRVLRHAAAILEESLRGADLLARWRGDAFAVLLPGLGRDEARGLLESALRKLRGKPFRTDEGGSFEINFSGGVVELGVDTSIEEAVEVARHQVYRAKNAGRGCIVAPDDDVGVRRHRVLLAEDDAAVARALVDGLEREGFGVMHVDNGAAALAAAHEGPVSLCLLDVNMPLIDGFEVLERLRRDPELRSLPIVMLTALGSEEDVSRGFRLGADDYIIKPFSPAAVAERIRGLLGRWFEGRMQDLDSSELYTRTCGALECFFAAASEGAGLDLEELAGCARRLEDALASDGSDLVSRAVDPSLDSGGHLVPHSANVAILGVRVGQALELEQAVLGDICLAGLVHEVGSITLPEGLLEAPRELTVEEMAQVRRRPVASAGMIRTAGSRFARVAEIAEQIHERRDGSGYPKGLRDDAIRIEAQILGAVDAFEASTHHRPFRRQARSPIDAIQNLINQAPAQHSETVAKAMIQSVGLFPVGSYVRLSTAEVARVVEHRGDNPMRPVLAVLTRTDGMRLSQPRVVDLRLAPQIHILGAADFIDSRR